MTIFGTVYTTRSSGSGLSLVTVGKLLLSRHVINITNREMLSPAITLDQLLKVSSTLNEAGRTMRNGDSSALDVENDNYGKEHDIARTGPKK